MGKKLEKKCLELDKLIFAVHKDKKNCQENVQWEK